MVNGQDSSKNGRTVITTVTTKSRRTNNEPTCMNQPGQEGTGKNALNNIIGVLNINTLRSHERCTNKLTIGVTRLHRTSQETPLVPSEQGQLPQHGCSSEHSPESRPSPAQGTRKLNLPDYKMDRPQSLQHQNFSESPGRPSSGSTVHITDI